MTTMNALRGIVNGASTANLLEMDHGQSTGTALKLNHLLFATAQTFSQIGSPLNPLVTLTVCALTPIAMLADSKKIVLFSDTAVNNLNIAYQTGIVANSVAMLALGNPVYALASLGVIVLNATATGQIKNILDSAKKACCAIALAAYGAQIFAAKGAMATLASTSAVLVGVKALLDFLEVAPKDSAQVINMSPVVEKVEEAVEKVAEVVEKVEDALVNAAVVLVKAEEENVKVHEAVVKVEEALVKVEEVIVSEKEVLSNPPAEKTVPWYFRPMFS